MTFTACKKVKIWVKKGQKVAMSFKQVQRFIYVKKIFWGYSRCTLRVRLPVVDRIRTHKVTHLLWLWSYNKATGNSKPNDSPVHLDGERHYESKCLKHKNTIQYPWSGLKPTH